MKITAANNAKELGGYPSSFWVEFKCESSYDS